MDNETGFLTGIDGLLVGDKVTVLTVAFARGELDVGAGGTGAFLSVGSRVKGTLHNTSNSNLPIEFGA